MKSVHRKVIGYASTPTATMKGTVFPNKTKEKSINLEMPRIFSMVREPRKMPANIRKTNSLLCCMADTTPVLLGLNIAASG